MNQNYFFSSMLVIGLASMLSCTTDKKDDDPYVTPGISALSVLNDGSSYETVYDSAFINGNNFGPGTIDLDDFTVEDNAVLHLAYYTTQPSQQDPIPINFRFSIDLNSGTELELPPASGQFDAFPISSWGRPKYHFFPYSNTLAGVQITQLNGYMFNYIGSTDVKLEFETAGIMGDPDLSYRNFVVNHVSTSYGAFSKASLGFEGIGAQYDMFFGTRQEGHSLYCVYKNYLYEDEFIAISINTDSVLIDRLIYSQYGSGMANPVFTTQRKTQIRHNQPIAYGTQVNRHYSQDGSVMTFSVFNENAFIINTYRYDFASNTLTQNLSNIALDGTGIGLDYDLDEEGNVYYTGYAGNGSNTDGVSVYKRTALGKELAGSDDFMISGKVVRLKFLNDKVYLAVTASQSQNSIHQISIIRQK